MVDVRFPHKKLRAVGVMFHPQQVSRSGGVSVEGSEQVVVSSAGRWEATLSYEVGVGLGMIDAQSRDRDTVLAWRAILALLEGRGNTLIIGPHDEPNAPAGIAGTAYGGLVPHSDGATFSDASQYEQPETPARLAAAVAVGVTSLQVAMLAGHAPEAGQYFSVGDRLHLIKSAAADAAVADRFTLSFWPPARDAWSAAQVAREVPVEFDRPQCRMKMATDGTGRLDLRIRYRGAPSVELVEDN